MLCSGAARPDDPALQGFALRNHNPFLQIFGLPPLQSAALASAGPTKMVVSLDLANNADFGENDREDFLIDGESYFLTISLRRRMNNWLELGVDLPFVAHDGGFMDSAIINWHDAFGMSNTKRRGPDDQVQFLYERDGLTLYELSSGTSGIGNVQLSAAMPLRETNKDGYAMAVRTSVKLPTGDSKDLLGSGAADLATGLYISDKKSLFNRPLGISGFAGVLLLGDGDVLPERQKNAVPFGGIAASWQVAERFTIITQLQAQGAYFESDIEELGGSTTQLGVGFSYRLRGSGRCLRFAVVEDVTADATTDFALHFAIVSRCSVNSPE
jgi:hypothetical protein